MSRDPLGLWGDPSQRGNGQSYCENDPVNSADPLGNRSIDPYKTRVTERPVGRNEKIVTTTTVIAPGNYGRPADDEETEQADVPWITHISRTKYRDGAKVVTVSEDAEGHEKTITWCGPAGHEVIDELTERTWDGPPVWKNGNPKPKSETTYRHNPDGTRRRVRTKEWTYGRAQREARTDYYNECGELIGRRRDYWVLTDDGWVQTEPEEWGSVPDAGNGR